MQRRRQYGPSKNSFQKNKSRKNFWDIKHGYKTLIESFGFKKVHKQLYSSAKKTYVKKKKKRTFQELILEEWMKKEDFWASSTEEKP